VFIINQVGRRVRIRRRRGRRGRSTGGQLARAAAEGDRVAQVARPARLVGPMLTRRLIECGLVDGIGLVSGADGGLSAQADQPVGVRWRTPVVRPGSVRVTSRYS
jgi:hypothetical protein